METLDAVQRHFLVDSYHCPIQSYLRRDWIIIRLVPSVIDLFPGRIGHGVFCYCSARLFEPIKRESGEDKAPWRPITVCVTTEISW